MKIIDIVVTNESQPLLPELPLRQSCGEIKYLQVEVMALFLSVLLTIFVGCIGGIAQIEKRRRRRTDG